MARPSTSARNAHLSVRDLTKAFGPRVVLERVSFGVAPGDCIGVVAANGTGKTTLLRLLAGLDVPDAGVVERRPHDALVGYLPQERERREGETLAAFLRRRTGVAGSEAALDAASDALARGDDGADDAYSEALDAYLALGGPDFDARVGEVLAEVGLDPRLLDVGMPGLSGGEAARASLAGILLSRFDVFLLDEPTNDLDFAGLHQLERFLATLGAAAVVVSHDRDFLDRTVNAVLEIDEHTHSASLFGGGFSAFLEERAVARRHAEEAYQDYTTKRDTLAGRAQREQQWSVQGVAKAKKSGETDKHIKQLKTNSSEHVAARARRTEKAIERLEAVDKPWEGWDLRFEIATAPRSGAVVARLTGAEVRRGSFTLGPIDLEIGWGERIALVGTNGSGKTTLISLLLGDLAPDVGERYLGPGVLVGTLAQARARFSAAPTLIDAFESASGLLAQECRSLLAKFGLGSEHVNRAAESLSPGERTRAELALLQARSVNFLILDEPTNHLDLPAIEQLETALASYDGTLLLVTHDRRMLDAVAFTRRVELASGRVVADVPV